MRILYMFSKIKSLFGSKKASVMEQVNDYDSMTAFLLGTQLDYIEFKNYYFLVDTTENTEILSSRGFTQEFNYNTELELDNLCSIGSVWYNELHEFLFILIKPARWETLNMAKHIAEASSKNIETQRKIIHNIFNSELKA